VIVKRRFTADDFNLNSDGGSVASGGTGVNAKVGVGGLHSVIAEVKLLDENNNPTEAETGLTAAENDEPIVVEGNTVAPLFAGGSSPLVSVTKNLPTSFDNRHPVLAIAASSGVLPANDGTITDGDTNDPTDDPAAAGAIPSDGFGRAAIDDADTDASPDFPEVAKGGLIQF
jgi:hypothetical protein